MPALAAVRASALCAAVVLAACGKTSGRVQEAGNSRSGDGGATLETTGGSAPTEFSLPPEVRLACSSYRPIIASYERELEYSSHGQGAPGEADGGAAAALGPCGTCIAQCSLEPVDGCEAQTDCVTRHCPCTRCESEAHADDFCACAATCMGPDDERCLQPWLDYASCLAAACSEVCVAPSRP